MGAGLSIKARNGRVYRRLKRLQRQLLEAGVNTVYHRYSLSHNDVYSIGGGFNIHYNWSYASNGESAAAPLVTIPADVIKGVTVDKRETYGGWSTQEGSLGTFEKGIERLKELFAVKTYVPEPDEDDESNRMDDGNGGVAGLETN